jgi:beta-lactamase regulating signal transducer with metallopeptidase domain
MLGWFAETTLVASALAVVAIAAGRLRSIGPAVRHALWLVVLIKMMTPPLVSWPWATPWRALEWPITSLAVTTASADVGVVHGDPSPPPALLAEPILLEAVSREMESPQPNDDDHGDDARAMSGVITSPETAVVASAAPVPAKIFDISLPDATSIRRGLLSGWLAVSLIVGIGQVGRIIRFRRLLRGAVPAPDDLVDEAELIGRLLGVSVPELLVVPDLGTPLLWCLGRPQLLLPGRLVKTLPFDRWRGILTHELAHLRRGDHWVSRLELAAGLIWWWNPLYWLTRARLDADAELACDAWVVWAQPKNRLAYAEVLFDLCATLSFPSSPAPTLGVAGSGRFLERRLTMILHDHVSCRLSPLGLLGACLLVLFALPSWSAANPAAVNSDDELTSKTIASAADQFTAGSVMDDDDDDKDDKDDKDEMDDDDEDDDDEADNDDDADDEDDDADDEDDDDKPAKSKKEKAKANKAKEKTKAKKSGSDIDIDIDLSRIEKEMESKFGPGSDFEKKVEAFSKEIESKFGPEFEKKMEAFGKEIESKFGPAFEKKMEAFGKEMESKFGPEFEKKMEAFGKEMESKFGPAFEKKMEAFGKEMESKLGPGSDFAKKMEAFGKEMGKKFGLGSEFEKTMKAVGEEMKEKYGPNSEFARKALEQAGSDSSKPRKQTEAKSKPAAKDRKRDLRIKELESQIGKLMEEIKALKADQD